MPAAPALFDLPGSDAVDAGSAAVGDSVIDPGWDPEHGWIEDDFDEDDDAAHSWGCPQPAGDPHPLIAAADTVNLFAGPGGWDEGARILGWI